MPVDIAQLERRLGHSFDDDQVTFVRALVANTSMGTLEDVEDEERTRSRLTQGAFIASSLGLSVTLGGAVVVVYGLGSPELLAAIADLLPHLVTLTFVLGLAQTVALIRWLRELNRNTRLLLLGEPRFSESEVTWGFFIPIVNLIRPYQVLRWVHARSDPDQLPNMGDVEVVKGLATYRQVAERRVFHPSTWRELGFPIGVYWGSYVLAALTGRSAVWSWWLSTSTGLLAALMGVLVVHTIQARRLELFRRMQRVLTEHEREE
ncbi:MAG: DUF4328 domain-containing protein [Myxococcales bacterium]|nr:DUF4328 domain-containing protein [Myxococcales bacterium]